MSARVSRDNTALRDFRDRLARLGERYSGFMVVTHATTSDLYLTYHSTDTLNRSLNSIIATYPSAWYYAHRT